QPFVGIQGEDMPVVGDQIVGPGGESSAKDRTVLNILWHFVAGGAGLDEVGPAGDSLPGQKRQAAGGSELLGQDAFELIEQICAGENAPPCPLGGGEHFFRNLAKKCFGHVNVGVEEDLHDP